MKTLFISTLLLTFSMITFGQAPVNQVAILASASDSFNKVKISEALYQGNYVFLIPINFSMEH